MPFKRKSMSKKRAPKRKSAVSWYNKKYSVGELAAKAWRGVKAIRGIVNSEKHYHDVVNYGTNIDYNGFVVALSDVAVGDTNVTRTGNSILAKSIHLRYDLSANVSSSATFCRVIIFEDTMSLGTIPSPGDLFTITGALHAPTSMLTIQWANQGRFKILYDQDHSFCSTGNVVAMKDVFLPLGNTHIKYTGTSGTDEGRNMIYMTCISNLVTTLLPSITYYSRLAFYDN